MFASRVVNPPSLGRLEPVPADRGGGGGGGGTGVSYPIRLQDWGICSWQWEVKTSVAVATIRADPQQKCIATAKDNNNNI